MGDKADKNVSLMVEGLTRAATACQGMPLFAQRKTPGLFAQSAAAKQAAQRCLESGFLQVVGVETKGKATFDLCTITEKGLRFLVGQANPHQVLDSLAQAMTHQGQSQPQLVAQVRACQRTYATLAEELGQLLGSAPVASSNGATAPSNGARSEQGHWLESVASFLRQWQERHPQQDCPLPELYRHVAPDARGLTIGQFHDGLRRLLETGHVRLYPWTGPLYELPEPALALLVGHAVTYYVSLRE